MDKNNQQISTISKIYSKALIDSARESNSVDSVKNSLANVLETLNSSDDLKVVLEKSSVALSLKTNILNEIFDNKIDDKVMNLLKILVEKRRLSEFEGICSAYHQMCDEMLNKKNVEIVSSVELDETTKSKITDKLQEKLNCEIIPNWSTDNNIIAGLVFKFDDYVIDTSLNTKLKNLSKNILR